LAKRRVRDKHRTKAGVPLRERRSGYAKPKKGKSQKGEREWRRRNRKVKRCVQDKRESARGRREKLVVKGISRATDETKDKATTRKKIHGFGRLPQRL